MIALVAVAGAVASSVASIQPVLMAVWTTPKLVERKVLPLNQLTAICTSRVATDERNHPQQTSCCPADTTMPFRPPEACAAAMSPAATAVRRRLAAPEWNCPVDWPTVALVSAVQDRKSTRLNSSHVKISY